MKGNNKVYERAANVLNCCNWSQQTFGVIRQMKKIDEDETLPKDEVERFQNASSKLKNFLSIIKRGD